MSNEDEQAKTDGTNVGAAAFLPAAVMAQVAPQPKKPIPNPPGTGKKAQKKARAQAKQAKYDTMMGMMARSTNDTGLGMMGMGMGAGPGYFNPGNQRRFFPATPSAARATSDDAAESGHRGAATAKRSAAAVTYDASQRHTPADAPADATADATADAPADAHEIGQRRRRDHGQRRAGGPGGRWG